MHSTKPLPTRPWPPNARGQDNLAGRLAGRLTVVGLAAGKMGSARGARWVVRCSCGAYEHRTTKFLRTGRVAKAMCVQCDWLAYQAKMTEGKTA